MSSDDQRREADTVRARRLDIAATLAPEAAAPRLGTLRRFAARGVPAGSRRRRRLGQAGVILDIARREGLGAVIEATRTKVRESTPAPGDPLGVGPAEYRRWVETVSPTDSQLAAMYVEAAGWDDAPLISVVVPTYDTRRQWLLRLVRSLALQVYLNWELVLADDASPSPETAAALEEIAALDLPVRVIRRDANGRISRATNDALAHARGEYVAFLDHDDYLEPHALFRVVQTLRADTTLDVVYSDEDMLLPEGTRGRAALKPDWSPHLLMGTNYVCHLVVARRSLVAELGGLRPDYDGAQDHDLLLRLSERTTRVAHIADILYRWCIVPGSVTGGRRAKPYAYEAGRRAVAESIARRGINAHADHGSKPGYYRVRYAAGPDAWTAVVDATGVRAAALQRTARALYASGADAPEEILLICNADERDELTAAVAAVTPPTPIHHITAAAHTGSRLAVAVARCHTPLTLVARGGAFPEHDEWFGELAGPLQLGDVAAVGPRLVSPTGRLCDGVVVGRDPVAMPVYTAARVAREVTAVLPGWLMLRTRSLRDAGGIAAAYESHLWAVDLCIRLVRDGGTVLSVPHVDLRDAWPESDDAVARDLRRLATVIGGQADPFLSPHYARVDPAVLRDATQPSG